MFTRWLKKRRNKKKLELIKNLREILPAKIVASRTSKKVIGLSPYIYWPNVDPFSSGHARNEIIKILADKLVR